MSYDDVVKMSMSQLRGKKIICYRKNEKTSYDIPHWHEYYELTFYNKCKGVCILNGEEYSLGDNSLFFLTPKDVHSIHSEVSPESSSIVICFLADVIDERLIDKASESPRVMQEMSATLKTLINRIQIVYSSKRKQSHSRPMLEFMLNAVLVEVLEKGIIVESENHHVNPSIEKAIIYINSDVTRNITLEEIADFCHVSPPYFSSLFHREMGKTLRRYINEARVEVAKHLLIETNKSVLDISMCCGYNTVAHFIKIFKAIEGITPSKYREKHKFQ